MPYICHCDITLKLTIQQIGYRTLLGVMCLLCSLCQWPKCSLIRIGNILFKIFFSSTNPIEPMPMYVCWYWITSEKIWKYADIRLLASKSQIFINCIYIRFHSDYIVGSWHRHSVDMEINNLQHKKNVSYSLTMIPFILLLADPYARFACLFWCALSWCWSWLKVGHCWLCTNYTIGSYN